MYQEAKRYRTEMRTKAERIAGAANGSDSKGSDVSSWEIEQPPMNADKQTGMRPVSKRAYKRGGAVEGEHERKRADRKPRASGGRSIANAVATTDEKEANKEEFGSAHMGALRNGGRARAHRMVGGPLADPISQGMGGQGRFSFNYPGVSKGVLKTGGKAKRASGGKASAQSGPTMRGQMPDLHEDTGGIKRGGRVGRDGGGSVGNKQQSQSPRALDLHEATGGVKRGGRIGHASGGNVGKGLKVEHVIVKKAEGGAVSGTGKAGDRIPRAHGGKLDAKERDALPKKDFGEPGKRAYPMPDKSHAANAKARASQMEAKGKLSESAKEKIDAKANKVLGREGRKHGGKTGKGKMSVNIVIAGGGHPQAPMGGGMPPPHPAAPVPVPQQPPMAMPMAMPVPMGGAPMGAPPMPGGMPPGGMGMRPPMMPPGMPMRKRGGKVLKMDEGSGGGLGRLEKVRKYGKNAHTGPEQAV